MENNNNTTTQIPAGWQDVNISSDMPIDALIHFMNILNQRICSLEDILEIDIGDGEKVTLTELYRRQSLEQMKQSQQGK